MDNRIRRTVFLAVSVSLAMILSFVESLVPPISTVPGIKIGLSNVVTVFLLYNLGWREAGGVSLVRVLLSALLLIYLPNLRLQGHEAIFQTYLFAIFQPDYLQTYSLCNLLNLRLVVRSLRLVQLQYLRQLS